MIFVFLTAIVLLIILGLTVGMTFGQEAGDSVTRSKLGQLLEIQLYSTGFTAYTVSSGI